MAGTVGRLGVEVFVVIFFRPMQELNLRLSSVSALGTFPDASLITEHGAVMPVCAQEQISPMLCVWM